MKKCPGCGSIGPDGESACGVCGENLSNVSTMTRTIEESEIEDQSRRRVEERLLTRKDLRREALKTLAGAIIGLVILIPGLVFESLWSVLLILIGALVLATAIFGGLGQGALDVFSLQSKRRRLLAEQSDKERARREQERD